MRTYVVHEKVNAETLRSVLLVKKLNTPRTEAAMASIRDLNRHVDFGHDLKPGTVLLVPETPNFRPAATEALSEDAFDGFQKLVRNAFDGAVEQSKAARRARAIERDELAKALKVAARVVGEDEALKDLLAAATVQLKAEPDEDQAAEETLAATSQAALAKLKELRGLLR